jgi:hypothetical protein
MADLNGLQVEDVMFTNNPWGIGPKDKELADGTTLNIMRRVPMSLPRSADHLIQHSRPSKLLVMQRGRFVN